MPNATKATPVAKVTDPEDHWPDVRAFLDDCELTLEGHELIGFRDLPESKKYEVLMKSMFTPCARLGWSDKAVAVRMEHDPSVPQRPIFGPLFGAPLTSE